MTSPTASMPGGGSSARRARPRARSAVAATSQRRAARSCRSFPVEEATSSSPSFQHRNTGSPSRSDGKSTRPISGSRSSSPSSASASISAFNACWAGNQAGSRDPSGVDGDPRRDPFARIDQRSPRVAQPRQPLAQLGQAARSPRRPCSRRRSSMPPAAPAGRAGLRCGVLHDRGSAHDDRSAPGPYRVAPAGRRRTPGCPRRTRRRRGSTPARSRARR